MISHVHPAVSSKISRGNIFKGRWKSKNRDTCVTWTFLHSILLTIMFDNCTSNRKYEKMKMVLGEIPVTIKTIRSLNNVWTIKPSVTSIRIIKLHLIESSWSDKWFYYYVKMEFTKLRIISVVLFVTNFQVCYLFM